MLLKLLLLLLFFIVSCAPTLEQRQARLDETCRGYGFTPGTDAYRDCWMRVDQGQRTRPVIIVQ